MRRSIVILFCGAIFAAGCSSKKDGDGGATSLIAGGSTFVVPIMNKWTGEYATAKGVKINYQGGGSGAGVQQMIEKTFDFGCTDSPMNKDQTANADAKGGEVVHIPIAMGGIVPAYNLGDVTELKFTGEVLADIFLCKIKKWNDPQLAALNPGTALPDKEIIVLRRGEASGTTFIFTEYLCKVSPDFKEKIGNDSAPNWPKDTTGFKGNDGVAGQLKKTDGSIGYIELVYALKSKIAYGSIRNRDGAFVRASLESVTAAANNSLASIPDDLKYSITDAPGKESYPISATTWAVFYKNQPADKGKAIVAFLRWIAHEGQDMMAEFQYSRLPASLIGLVDKKLDTITYGQ